MDRIARLALIACLALVACKGDPVVQPDPQALEQLRDCSKALEDKTAYIAALEKQIADLKMAQAIPVAPAPDAEPPRPTGKPAADRPRDARGSAGDAELYAAFEAALQRSRGAIEKCYQSALKHDTSLQARPVTLSISVDYRTTGAVASATFSPRLATQFDQCMDTVAKRWSLPAMPSPVTFSYKQTLTPE